MSVKRYPDKAGLLPDAVVVNLENSDGEAERAAILEILEATSDMPRIERLRRHDQLQTLADNLARRSNAIDGSSDLALSAATYRADG